tara:strand:- start:126 stop:680 length:555 start_codon:yes stop_codon:yes gene_type:complete
MAITRLGPNQLLNLANNVTGTLPASNGGTGATSFSPGKVLQVVQTNFSTTFATTSNSLVDITPATVTITPSSSSNKVLVQFTMYCGGSGDEVRLSLLRGSTVIGNNSATQTEAFTGIIDQYRMNTCNYTFLDSPSTTSATTYKLQILAASGHTIYINSRHYNAVSTGTSSHWGNSVITVMEIAA